MSIKVDFIVCSNNKLYKNELRAYINELTIPIGFEIDVIVIEGARGLAEAYNTAMYKSNAKYKVYLHQDVFIINKNFINDIFYIFNKHPEVGMLGVLGSDILVKEGCYWDRWNVGRSYASVPLEVFDYKLSENGNLKYVQAIDGMIMITQYDIPWQSEYFDKFDFYDISQSTEMTNNGYRVAVPPQHDSWCLHDCGCSKFSNYENYREVFCNKYSENGYEYIELDNQNSIREKGIIANKYFEMASNAFNTNNKELFDYMMVNSSQLLNYSTDLQILQIIWEWYTNNGYSNWDKSLFDCERNYEACKEYYTKLKFILRRIEFGVKLGEYEDLLRNTIKSETKLFLFWLIQYVSREPLVVEKYLNRYEESLNE